MHYRKYSSLSPVSPKTILVPQGNFPAKIYQSLEQVPLIEATVAAAERIAKWSADTPELNDRRKISNRERKAKEMADHRNEVSFNLTAEDAPGSGKLRGPFPKQNNQLQIDLQFFIREGGIPELSIHRIVYRITTDNKKRRAYQIA